MRSPRGVALRASGLLLTARAVLAGLDRLVEQGPGEYQADVPVRYVRQQSRSGRAGSARRRSPAGVPRDGAREHQVGPQLGADGAGGPLLGANLGQGREELRVVRGRRREGRIQRRELSGSRRLPGDVEHGPAEAHRACEESLSAGHSAASVHLLEGVLIERRLRAGQLDGTPHPRVDAGLGQVAMHGGAGGSLRRRL